MGQKLGLVVAFVVVLGCGAGAEDEGTFTVEEGCTEISDAFCRLGVDCAVIDGDEYLDCFDGLYAECCPAATCDPMAESARPRDLHEECIEALAEFSCELFERGDLPADCQ